MYTVYNIYKDTVVVRSVSIFAKSPNSFLSSLMRGCPRNILERVACTLIVLTAGLCWAYVLGEVCAIVSDAWIVLLVIAWKMSHILEH